MRVRIWAIASLLCLTLAVACGAEAPSPTSATTSDPNPTPTSESPTSESPTTEPTAAPTSEPPETPSPTAATTSEPPEAPSPTASTTSEPTLTADEWLDTNWEGLRDEMAEQTGTTFPADLAEKAATAIRNSTLADLAFSLEFGLVKVLRIVNVEAESFGTEAVTVTASLSVYPDLRRDAQPPWSEAEFTLSTGDPEQTGVDAAETESPAAVVWETIITVEKVKRYLREGTDINARDIISGETLLHQAVKLGDPEVIELLLAEGADISAITDDARGHTPLHSAVRAGNHPVVETLLDAGVDIQAPNNFGETPLYYAVESGDMSMVGLLLDRGANPGETVCALAESRGTVTALLWERCVK